MIAAVASRRGSWWSGATSWMLAGIRPPDGTGIDELRESVRRMAAAAEANRAAIERGLALQMRLIQAIAQAVPRARAEEAPVYQPDGSQVPARPPEAYAFLSQM